MHESAEDRLNRLPVGLAGTWSWDVLADRLYADERAARLYGLEPEAAATGLPRSVYGQRVHPEDVQGVVEFQQTVLRDGGLHANEYRVVRPDGSVRKALIVAQAFRNRQGVVAQYAGSVFDVTDRDGSHAPDAIAALLDAAYRRAVAADRMFLAYLIGMALQEAIGWGSGPSGSERQGSH